MATELDATGFYSKDVLADPSVIARGQARLDFHLRYMDECDARDAEKKLARGNAETIEVQPKLAGIEVLRRQTRNTLDGRG